jgi:hypothetical protein
MCDTRDCQSLTSVEVSALLIARRMSFRRGPELPSGTKFSHTIAASGSVSRLISAPAPPRREVAIAMGSSTHEEVLSPSTRPLRGESGTGP